MSEINVGPYVLERDNVDCDIHLERIRQDKKWGEQNHDPFRWLAILGEEVGECNRAAIESFDWKKGRFKADVWDRPNRLESLREELVQVAAVTKAFIECLDRDKWR